MPSYHELDRQRAAVCRELDLARQRVNSLKHKYDSLCQQIDEAQQAERNHKPLAAAPATTRINPAEMRFLRVKVQQLHVEGQPIACTLRTVVVSAAVALDICLKDEAEYFEREYEHQRQSLRHLSITR